MEQGKVFKTFRVWKHEKLQIENQTDKIVCELYGLKEEEIKIVEGN